MHPKPAVVAPDVELWAVGYLTVALAARAEDYADARVTNGLDEDNTGRIVTVRDDGGPRGLVTKNTAVAVNVWADGDAEAGALARLVVALLEAAPGDGPVVGHAGSAGPVRVPEGGERPHWFGSVDLVVRGSAL